MQTFRELFEAKKITIKNFPKSIGKAELGVLEKTTGYYSYTQIDYDEYGDYGDEGERYYQGYTLEVNFKITDVITINTEVTDLGTPAKSSFNEKYSNLTFDSIKDFIKTVDKIVKEFDKF